MIQKVMIDVDSSTPLHNMGDGHIIVYDMSKRRYYATTRESFMREQNLKIENLEKTIKEFMEKMENNQVKFAEEMQNEKNSFLKTYKETNSKIIEMIEKHIME